MHSSSNSFPSTVGELENLRSGEINDDTELELEAWLKTEIVCLVSSASTKGQVKISLR